MRFNAAVNRFCLNNFTIFLHSLSVFHFGSNKNNINRNQRLYYPIRHDIAISTSCNYVTTNRTFFFLLFSHSLALQNKIKFNYLIWKVFRVRWGESYSNIWHYTWNLFKQIRKSSTSFFGLINCLKSRHCWRVTNFVRNATIINWVR